MAGAPADLEQQNACSVRRGDEHMIINFPIGSRPHENLAASVHGQIGDVAEGFAEADEIVERTYESTQAQQCPTEPHICFTYMDGERLVIHASTQVPWHVRRQVARIVGMKQHQVHVIKERVGAALAPSRISCWKRCAPGRPESPVRLPSATPVKRSSSATPPAMWPR